MDNRKKRVTCVDIRHGTVVPLVREKSNVIRIKRFFLFQTAQTGKVAKYKNYNKEAYIRS